MKPVSLKREDFAPMPFGGPDKFPKLWLDGLTDVDIPEEGEIRFRFSRIAKIEKEDRSGESTSVELVLKKITDICDCKGKDAEYNENRGEEMESEDEGENKEMDAEEALDAIMEDLDEEDMMDESEDDNPEKY
jgi:hypothetical protein